MPDDLGNSAVPYSPIIIAPKDKPLFIPTLYEYLSFIGERETRTGFGNGGAGGIWTVPDNYVLFITNINVSVSVTNSAASTTTVYKDASGGDTKLCSMRVRANAGEYKNENISITPNIPIMIEGGSALYVSTSANSVAYATVIGFIVRKDSIPQI